VCVIPWGAKGQIDGLDDAGFYRIIFRQLHQKYRGYQLSPMDRSLGECCGAGKHLDAVYLQPR